MATTYTLISSNTLSASAASVTFSAIPSTYTDLVLKVSARTTASNYYDEPTYTFNGDTATNYSLTQLRGNGSAAASGQVSSSSVQYLDYTNGNTSTANSFGSSEIYIPNYTSTSARPSSAFSVNETNASAAFMDADALLYRGSSAISSVTFSAGSNQFISGSSFYLYGIKNS